ncbi:FKBP-type peptidyl-prolyl cis-trans isomerase [Archangium lipolyticum]|uniref:FKBP-type peptidyl-prolyl cis-trans isomerase n=1 Tax=Archangium lipolyticum TaxID=2970465 RepID=UPI002149D158|nr:FKBP-type peptidyl-prolyl cis-trans isomerase [Archangium lipolyticum]
MMRRPLPSLSACLLAFTLSACGPSESGDPTKVQYAPALGVDLAAMNRSDTGLYTQDLVEGTGAVASSGRTAVVHYSGWLPDGTLFDTSRDTGQTFSFVVGAGRVIRGWDEGVADMRVGGQRRLVIPSPLGYGELSNGPIPPNSVLIFDVELLGVK